MREADAGMTEGMVIELARQAMFTTLVVAGPILLLGAVTGLVIGVFQAMTQINEQTLAFAPKIIVVMLGVLVLGPWMFSRLVDFTTGLLVSLPEVIK